MHSEVLDLQSTSKSHSAAYQQDWKKSTFEEVGDTLEFATAQPLGTAVAPGPSPNIVASKLPLIPLAKRQMAPLRIRPWAPKPGSRLNPVSIQGDVTQIQSMSGPQRLARFPPSSLITKTDSIPLPGVNAQPRPLLNSQPAVTTVQASLQKDGVSSRALPLHSSVPRPRSPVTNSQLQVPSRPSIPSNPIICNIPLAPSQDTITCLVCATEHAPGHCPLRNAEIQQCPACGYSHLHKMRTCPLLQDLEHVEAMYRRLNESTESSEIVRSAKYYLSGVRGALAARKTDGRKKSSGTKSDDVVK
jgi:Chromatin remodeling factor Mit1 C-terminal Zn finger 2